MNINIATWGRLVRRAIPTVNHSGTFSPQASVPATVSVVDVRIPELAPAARYVSKRFKYISHKVVSVTFLHNDPSGYTESLSVFQVVF
jgi:hypothetical protein